MGAAEVISFEEVRARKQWGTLRQQLHERFDQWLDTLETAVARAAGNLIGSDRNGVGLAPAAHRGHHRDDRGAYPPWVNTSASRPPVRGVTRVFRCKSTSAVRSRRWWGQLSLSGPISIVALVVWVSTPSMTRWVWWQGVNSSTCNNAAAKLVTEVPYDTAQSLFGDLTGVPFGSERMHTVTNQVAEGLTVLDVAPSRQEIERRMAAVAAGRFRRPVVVLGIDGAYVPTRPDSARERRPGREGSGPSGRCGVGSGAMPRVFASISSMAIASSIC